jgi:DNA-binding LytR/AlgR family response regulator
MRCLIVDDDPVICDQLEYFCQKTPAIASVTTTNSGFESINLIHDNFFDVIMLDYDLPDINGSQIIEAIPDETKVIMVTSHRDFAADSYNYPQIIDYIVKPVDFARFHKAIQKMDAYRQHTEEPGRIFVKDGNKLVKIELDQVDYFKSEANYISVHLGHKRVLTLMTIKELEKRLPAYFQRIHRSYIINLNKIESIEQNTVKLGVHELPISSTYEKELLKKINLLN